MDCVLIVLALVAHLAHLAPQVVLALPQARTRPRLQVHQVPHPLQAHQALLLLPIRRPRPLLTHPRHLPLHQALAPALLLPLLPVQSPLAPILLLAITSASSILRRASVNVIPFKIQTYHI